VEYCGRAIGAPVTCCCPYAGAKVAKAYTAKVYTDPVAPNFTDNTNVRRGVSHASTCRARWFFLAVLLTHPSRTASHVVLLSRAGARSQKFKCSSVSCVKTAAQCNEVLGGTTKFC
jgi:hypothetical protein